MRRLVQFQASVPSDAVYMTVGTVGTVGPKGLCVPSVGAHPSPTVGKFQASVPTDEKQEHRRERGDGAQVSKRKAVEYSEVRK